MEQQPRWKNWRSNGPSGGMCGIPSSRKSTTTTSTTTLPKCCRLKTFYLCGALSLSSDEVRFLRNSHLRGSPHRRPDPSSTYMEGAFGQFQLEIACIKPMGRRTSYLRTRYCRKGRRIERWEDGKDGKDESKMSRIRGKQVGFLTMGRCLMRRAEASWIGLITAVQRVEGRFMAEQRDSTSGNVTANLDNS